MSDAQLFPVVIADLTAWGFSTPEELAFGGAQRLGVHQLPAGVRVIDSLGPDDSDISWKGTFLRRYPGDPDPVESARHLDYLRKAGAPVTLSWDAFQYLVVIEHFTASYEFPSRVGFTILMKVVEDQVAPTDSFGQNDVNTLVNSDFQNTLTAAPALNMNVPAGLPSSFSSTIGAATPGSQAITWSGSNVATENPGGNEIPMFNTSSEASQFTSDHPGWSADYTSSPTLSPDPSSPEWGATNPDGSAVPVFNSQAEALQYEMTAPVGYSADYFG